MRLSDTQTDAVEQKVSVLQGFRVCCSLLALHFGWALFYK